MSEVATREASTILGNFGPHRQSLTSGKQNVIHKPLIKPNKILPPPLHIKLGLMKNFVKALDVKGPAFTCLCGKFPSLTYEKVKASVFIGPQISDEHGEFSIKIPSTGQKDTLLRSVIFYSYLLYM